MGKDMICFYVYMGFIAGQPHQKFVPTVGLQCPWLTASASCLVNSLDNKNILGATLQAVHCVVVLLDVGNNHPALQRVAQAWEERGNEGEIRRKRQRLDEGII